MHNFCMLQIFASSKSTLVLHSQPLDSHVSARGREGLIEIHILIWIQF